MQRGGRSALRDGILAPRKMRARRGLDVTQFGRSHESLFAQFSVTPKIALRPDHVSQQGRCVNARIYPVLNGLPAVRRRPPINKNAFESLFRPGKLTLEKQR
jgi:hypothetical protein